MGALESAFVEVHTGRSSALAWSVSFTRSPTFLSLASHELHHEHPKVPVAELPALSLALR